MGNWNSEELKGSFRVQKIIHGVTSSGEAVELLLDDDGAVVLQEKWERFDEIVESGGYTYIGFRSLTDSTYRVKRIKDDTHAAAYCYGTGTLPAAAGWTGLVYA